MRNVLTVISILLFINASSQNNNAYVKDSVWINKALHKMIELTSTGKQAGLAVGTLPFESFNIKDVTADSSYIGVTIKAVPMSNFKTFEKVTLKRGTSVSFTHYLNRHPALSFVSTGVALTCFIKRLRITEIDSLNKLTNGRELYRRLTFEAEGYLNKENIFYPALRLDTLAISLCNDKNDYTVIANVLEVLAAKSAILDTGKIFNRKSYTSAELDRRYEERYNKPVLQAQHLNRGIYKTFDEFINNNPSVKEFEYNTRKAGFILYARDNANDWIPERTAFGFCDGKVIWINVKNGFRPLVRRSNTFEFLDSFHGLDYRAGHRSASILQGTTPLAAIGASVLATAATNAMYSDPDTTTIFQLDLEQGNFY